MRTLVLALTTCASACAAGIAPTGADSDAGTGPIEDATSSVDAAEAGCQVYVSGAATDRGKVGSSGGSKVPLECDDAFGSRIVGIALQMSDQNTVYGGRSAQGIMIECASLTIDETGAPHLAGARTRQISGTGTFGWSPSTWTPMTRCPEGSVLTGLLAHLGASGNRFLDVTMSCTALDARGKLGATTALKITGSLVSTAASDQAACGPGEVVSGLGAFTGAGLDAVSLFCAAPTCR